MLPMAILLGGRETALAVVRSLGRRGVRVLVSAPRDHVATRSRYCAEAATFAAGSGAAYWSELLLGARSERLHGAVLLATNDEGLEFVAQRHAELSRRYRLDMQAPQAQLALLDKQRTLELARAAGIATPGFWRVDSLQDLERALAEARFPALVKPVHSHRFQAIFGRKHFAAGDADALAAHARTALEAGVAFIVSELVPGPDSLLSSYYTYITPEGESLFHLTKRVLRRYPANEGGATYHVTEWLPATAAAGKAFFDGIAFRGMGNVEFKLDRRDGRLKLIECNARFTAATSLVVRAGIDTPWISYSRAAGIPTPASGERFREGLCLWYPHADLRAFRQLHRDGRLSAAAWLRSLARPMSTPYFTWDDPRPFAAQLAGELQNLLGRLRAPQLARPRLAK